jgi:hypothetical protein
MRKAIKIHINRGNGNYQVLNATALSMNSKGYFAFVNGLYAQEDVLEWFPFDSLYVWCE